MKAHISRLAASILVAGLTAACGKGGDNVSGADDPLACAAALSAYTNLVAEGYVAPEPKFESAALVSGMTYLNSYAIPNGLSEEQAFAELEIRREELRSTASSEEIVDQAWGCIENTPEL